MMQISSIPKRIKDTESKIDGFQNLPNGWHYGSGVAPSPHSIALAHELNFELANIGFMKTNAFPGVDGAIQVAGYYDSLYVELTIETNQAITFLLERNGTEVAYAENLTISEALQNLSALRV